MRERKCLQTPRIPQIDIRVITLMMRIGYIEVSLKCIGIRAGDLPLVNLPEICNF